MSNAFILSYCFVPLAGLGYIYFGLMASLRREMFRCEVRRIRDGLFDFMRKGGHDFNDPAYRKARNDLNAILAASNKFSLTFIFGLVFVAVAAWRRNRGQVSYQTTPKAADPKVAEQIQRAYFEAVWTMIDFSFLKGVLGKIIWGTLYGIGYVLRLRDWFRKAKQGFVTDGAQLLQTAGTWAVLPASALRDAPWWSALNLTGRV